MVIKPHDCGVQTRLALIDSGASLNVTNEDEFRIPESCIFENLALAMANGNQMPNTRSDRLR